MTETLAVITGLALMSIHTDFEIDTERVLREFNYIVNVWVHVHCLS